MSEHAYAAPHVIAGRRLHGGFDAEGAYVSPRTLLRWPAVHNWSAALRARGGEPLACSSGLLAGVRVPNDAQQKLLLQVGLGQTFWNTLTITGVIEARGKLLAEIPIPRFQDAVVEDISEMALGHLHLGLLKAHGLDEGGDQALGTGGHDVMWFALRDLAFGETGYPQPELPTTITRPDASEPFPELPRPQARMLSFLMNLLLIELRAEIGFSSTEALLSDPELFAARRQEAGQAVELVRRIRKDEELHLESLRVALGEARAVHWKSFDGGQLPGHTLIDPFWERLVHWATVEQPRLVAERSRTLLSARILAHPEGANVLQRFDALAT
ncbi:MAG: hypothetical protein ACHQ53_02130 [Polyangiales bacterium]